MVGQTQRPWVRQNPKFLSDPMSDKKKKFSLTLVIVTCWFLVVYGFDKSTWT